MAKLGVAAGGAAVGAAIGSVIPGVGTLIGASIGFSLGSVAGQLLFPDKIEGPRLNESAVQTSGYGVPIPIVAARGNLAGNVIWADKLKENRKKKRQGKGGPNVTTYTYTRSFAVGFCEFLIPAPDATLIKLWLDEKLIYDASGDSETVSVGIIKWRVWGGQEDLLPDPLIEAKLGDDAPAFRGLFYIVFEDLPLEPFGGRVPNVTAEIVSSATPSFPQVNSVAPTSPIFPTNPSYNTYYTSWPTNVAVDYARGRIYEGRTRATGYTGIGNDEIIRVYDLSTMETIGEYPMGDMVEHLFTPPAVPLSKSVGAGIMHLGVDGFLYVTGGSDSRTCLWKIDPDAWRAVGVFGPPGGNGNLGADNGTRIVFPMQIRTIQVQGSGAPRTLVVVQGGSSTALTVDADTMTYLWGAGGVPTFTVAPEILPINLGIGPLNFPCLLIEGEQRSGESDLWVVSSSYTSTPLRLEVMRVTYTYGAINLGSGIAGGISTTTFDYIDMTADIDSGASRCMIQGGWYDYSDGTLVLQVAGAGSTATGWSRFSSFKWHPTSGGVWAVNSLPMPTYHDARGEQRRVLSGEYGMGGNWVLDNATGSEIINAAGSDFNNLYWLDERIAQIGYRSSGPGAKEIGKRYLKRISPDVLTVGDIVAALCERAGMEPTDYDTTDLDDTIRGYQLSHPMDARSAISTLASAYLFDAAEVDDVLTFRKRGGAVVATVEFDDMIRESADQNVLEEARAQDADIAREITVRFYDFYRQWEQGAQSWRRAIEPTPTMTSRGSAVLDLPIPLDSGEAKTIARRMLTAAWRERSPFTFSVGPQHARLVPTDPIYITTRDGATIRCRITAVDDGANWVRRIQAVQEDAASYSLTATADNGGYWDAPTIPAPYASRLILPDLALIRDGEDMGQTGLREYAFAVAYDGDAWLGVRVALSYDGTVWSEIGTVTDPIPWGAVTDIGTAPRTPWTWDEDGAITVRMTDGEPESATSAEVLNWENMGALVASDGTAEIFQWRTATDNGDGTFTLTGLLRGRRGTEDLIASRTDGCLFLLLDDPLLYAAGTDDDTVTVSHRALAVYDTTATASPTFTKSLRGRAEKPYAPAHITGTRDGGLNLTITGLRRTRFGGEWRNGTGTVPLNEASEAYECDILGGPDVSVAARTASHGVATNLFDGSSSTSISAIPTLIITVQFNSPVEIGAYAIVGSNVFTWESPTAWVLDGSSDGVSWTTVDARSGISGWSLSERREYAATTPGSYIFYRLTVTHPNGPAGRRLSGWELLAFSGGDDLARIGYTQAARRTITSSTLSFSYSAADQTTDFGAPLSAVPIKIYQMSAIVGRGIAAEATV